LDENLSFERLMTAHLIKELQLQPMLPATSTFFPPVTTQIDDVQHDDSLALVPYHPCWPAALLAVWAVGQPTSQVS
jgi:hypothetical protein